MQLKIIAILFLGLMLSCKAKNNSPSQLQDDLKQTMQAYLYNAVHNDSSNVKYRVEDVTYFEDSDKFICEFKVNMKAKMFDTTGTMKAYISKDLKTVKRLY